MFSSNRSANRISVARSDNNRAPHVPQKQSEQQKYQKRQPYWGAEDLSGGQPIGIRLPRLLNTGIQSSIAAATNRLLLPPPALPPPPPTRSATTSLSLIPLFYQRIAEQDTPPDQRLTSEFLEIRLEAVSRPCWVQASLSIFTK
ncbi:unnamed protein product [Litomosoides sigmodontis]|uniref:Uncharacterized protein n=1 Tax=Litomosoides sigmodontis TaxID=42156 RepID=A0A3P6VFH4_LITSI|nr:unnamed protein product [Litomosoides sigmodontis]